MSLVALGHHYIRNGLGDEQLYDLRTDPFERVNLMGPASGNDEVAVFRQMLLDVLTDNPGSIEVEKAYLATYRRWLEDLVRGHASQRRSRPVIEIAGQKMPGGRGTSI